MKRNLVYFTAVTKFTLTLSWACEIRCAKVLWGNLWVKVRDYLHKESGPLPGRDWMRRAEAYSRRAARGANIR